MKTQRRSVLKMAAAGAAGLALGKPNKAFAAWPATGAINVNSTISNMRVVACYDARMMSAPASMTFAAENAAVNAAQVAANMDAMAISLAGSNTADAAWRTIFTSSKAWSATKVAIKVNVIEPKNMARIAVVQKFCQIFAALGVPGANITIYDGNSTFGSGITNYTPYFSLTDATKIAAVVSSYNAALGGTVTSPIPGGTSADCTADIANGTIDILVNIANNKGHSMPFNGGVTLSMKNHFGTFAPNHDLNYIFDINKSDAILGGTPVRQQLCFIDSLIANKASNTGTPEAMPNYLVMGTFAPAVDYATIMNLRKAVMGITPASQSIVDSYITTFGYATTDPKWVLVQPASSDGGTTGSSSSSSGSPGGSSSTSGSSSSGSSGGSSSSSGSSSGSSSTSSSSGAVGSNSSSGGTISGGTSSGGGSSIGAGSTTGGSRSASEAPAGGSSGGGCDVALVNHDSVHQGGLLVVGALAAGVVRRAILHHPKERGPSRDSSPDATPSDDSELTD